MLVFAETPDVLEYTSGLFAVVLIYLKFSGIKNTYIFNPNYKICIEISQTMCLLCCQCTKKLYNKLI